MTAGSRYLAPVRRSEPCGDSPRANRDQRVHLRSASFARGSAGGHAFPAPTDAVGTAPSHCAPKIGTMTAAQRSNNSLSLSPKASGCSLSTSINPTMSLPEKDGDNDLRACSGVGRQVARVSGDIADHHRLARSDSRATESLAAREPWVRRWRRSVPADEGDLIRCDVVDADPAISAEATYRRRDPRATLLALGRRYWWRRARRSTQPRS
jgi:hypothetical protein